MKLRVLHLGAAVVIEGAKAVSGGVNRITEQAFHVDDGWELDALSGGQFRIWREDMAEPVIAGGCSYTFVEEVPKPAKGKSK